MLLGLDLVLQYADPAQPVTTADATRRKRSGSRSVGGVKGLASKRYPYRRERLLGRAAASSGCYMLRLMFRWVLFFHLLSCNM